MANLLNEGVVQQIKEIFGQLKAPVEVLFFGKKEGCDYCADTAQLLEEVTALSDKLQLSQYDLDDDQEIARRYNIDKAPCFVILGRNGEQLVDYGIRFAGIPSGHEFSSLIHDLILVSGQDSGLSQKTRQSLNALEKPVLLQVFVTPT